MGLLKAILYAFLLWMPTYLTSNNMAYYKSTVPIFFNIGGLIGSFFLGYLYNDL
jgi:sugar phosphate permease